MSQVSRMSMRHRELEQKLEEELHRPFPDQIVISTLKKRKLAIKDQVSDHFPRMS